MPAGSHHCDTTRGEEHHHRDARGDQPPAGAAHHTGEAAGHVERGGGHCAGGRGRVADAVAQVDGGGERRRRAEQRERQHLATSAFADLALLDVAGHSLADEHIERAVPSTQDGVEHRAVVASRSGHGERAQAPFHAAAHAVHERVPLFRAHTECEREVGTLQALAHAQLEHQLVALVEAACGAAHELGQLTGSDHLAFGVGRCGRGQLRHPHRGEVGGQGAAASS